MTIISQSTGNLMGGISQQPDPLKLPGQVRDATNVLLDPTFGCKKRPPTKFVAQLADDISTESKWFQIFRDEGEKYIATIYKDGGDNVHLRVFEAETGVERVVNVVGDSLSYLDYGTLDDLGSLTVNDYTFLYNNRRLITMDQNSPETGQEEAIVVINQVGYDTTYAIDFLKDGEQLVQDTTYGAKRVSVSPSSWIDTSNGNCSATGTETREVNHPSDPTKTGLEYTLTVTGTPVSVPVETPGESYPTGAGLVSGYTQLGLDYGLQCWCTSKFGPATSQNFAQSSQVYTYETIDFGGVTAQVQVNFGFTVEPTVPAETINGQLVTYYRWVFASAAIQSYGEGAWSTGMQGVVSRTLTSNLNRYPSVNGAARGEVWPSGSDCGYGITITSINTTPTQTTYEYDSSYKASVSLKDGGEGWRIGDTISTTLEGKTYTIRVEEEGFTYNFTAETVVEYTTPDDTVAGSLTVGGVVGALTVGISELPEYEATPIGNTIYIKRLDGRSFNIMTRGGSANQAMYGIKGAVNDVSLLPTQGMPGVKLKVRNTLDSAADDYYVKFVSAAANIPGQGAWEETVAPGIVTDLNPASMPHALIREGNGEFTLRPLSREFNEKLCWAPRAVGDDDTNPEPTFVGRGVKDMFFYMNRLGILADDSVVLSQPGDYFNFFANSAIAVSDADPIDMTASATKPAILRAAVGTPKGLLLFAENSQFLLATTEAAFGPSTVKMAEISSYSYNSRLKPLESGMSILFSTEADTFTKVFEMAVDSVTERPLVADNTRIIPELIPTGLKVSATSPNNSFMLFGDGSNRLWGFSFYNVGGERSLAGWSKWELPQPIQLISFAHDTGYIVMNNGGAHILCKLEMLDDPATSSIHIGDASYTPRLDNYLYKSEMTVVDNLDGTHNVYFPAGAYVVGAEATVIFNFDGTSAHYQKLAVSNDVDGYYLVLDDGLATADFMVGLNYTMSVTLPSFYFTPENKRADWRNPPVIQHLYMNLYQSGLYSVAVDRLGYDPYYVDLDTAKADVYLANTAPILEASTRAIPVFCKGDMVTVTVSAADPLPASLIGYTWEGHYNNRGINATN